MHLPQRPGRRTTASPLSSVFCEFLPQSTEAPPLVGPVGIPEPLGHGEDLQTEALVVGGVRAPVREIAVQRAELRRRLPQGQLTAEDVGRDLVPGGVPPLPGQVPDFY